MTLDAVQISPDDQRAVYAGVFGAANIGLAVLPLASGALTAAVGYPAVFVAASVVALCALPPARRMDCGGWYRET